MTIKEGIYDIRETLKSYNIDSEISNRHIYYLMNMYRRQIIRQHIQRNPGEWRDQLTQTMFFSMWSIDSSRFPSNITTDMTITKTVLPVPAVVGQDIFKSLEVRPVDRLSFEIEMIPKSRAVEVQYAPKGFVYGYIDDDRFLFLLGRDSLHKFMGQITVTAILEDPKDAESLDSTLEVTEYYLPANLWVNVKSQVLKNIDFNIPIDTLNNDKDNQATQAQG